MEQKRQRGMSRRSGRQTVTDRASTSVEGGNVADRAGNGNGSARNDEVVRTRAYYLYLERGCAPGGELDDWLRAEREMSSSPPAA